MDLLETMNGPTGRTATAYRLRISLDSLDHTVLPEMLDRFAAGSATPEECRTVVRHLLKGCPSCSRRLGRHIPLEHLQEPEDAEDQALERSLDHAFAVLTASPTAPATRMG